MTSRYTWRAGLALALAAVLGGCDEGLTELNVNPNEPVDVGAEFLLSNAIEAAASRVHGSSLNMDLTGLWVQHYAESRYSEQDRYELTDASVETHWTNFYVGPLQDLQEVIEQGEAAERPNVVAIGTILQSWIMQVITDLWGDAGYSQALQGRSGDAVEVAYDPQSEIYAGILADLEAASAMIQPGGVAIDDGDLLYGGDMAKWRKFANSLRLRAAMRLSEVDEATARAEFTDALAAGVFTSNADNAVLWYVANGVDVHPIFAYQRNRDDHAVSKTLVDTLRSLSDPRLPVYALPNAAGQYRGVPNGDLNELSLDSISRIGTYFSREDAPAVLMSYAEVLLLQAEAAERGWITASAADLYRQAITASLQDLGIAQAEIDAYLAQPRVQYQGGEAGLRQIALQKWIVLFGNGPEAYAEWRRTGYPQLTAGPDAINDGQIPVRLPYPAIESQLNAASVQAAITRQGGAGMNDALWWDKP